MTEYSTAIGNRDPVSENLACLCGGCRMTVAECDMPNCSGEAKALADLAAFRKAGYDEPRMLEEMVQKYGPDILATPPSHGGHLTAWVVPFLAVILGVIILAIILKKKTSRAPEKIPGTVSDEDLKAVENAMKDPE